MWAELLRLRELVGLPRINALSARMKQISRDLRGASQTVLYDKLSPKSTKVEQDAGHEKLEDSLFVRAYVQACYDCCTSRQVTDPAAQWGSLEDWEAWAKALWDDQFKDSPLPPRTARGRYISPAEKERKLAEAAKRAQVLSGSGVVATLRQIYPGYPLVELWGTAMPICTFPAPPSDWHDLESPRGLLLGLSVPGVEEWDQEFDRAGLEGFQRDVERYKHADSDDRRHFFPGPTYALHAIRNRPGGRVTLDCTMGRYFTSMATSERLDDELMHELEADPDRPVPLEKLKRRSWLHDQLRELDANSTPVVNGKYRAGAVSHATVVMLANTEGGYDILLPSRSDEVATHARFRHVAPSGIFAPLNAHSPSRHQEFSVRRNFYREWVEELYNAKEYEGWELDQFRPEAVADPEEEPEIGRLLEVIDPNSARRRGDLYYTGVSVNLLTLRPEICLLLVIDDPDWLTTEIRESDGLKRPLVLSWEYLSSSGQLAETERLRLSADLYPADGKPLDPSFLVPNAAAAISLALKVMTTR